MKRKILIFIGCIGFLQLSVTAFAVQKEGVENIAALDSLCSTPLLLHFRFDRSLVEYDYMDNPHTLREFQTLFSDSLQLSRIDTVSISSYASPDGNTWYNSRLAYQRAVAVKGYLIWKYPGLDQHRIVVRSQGEDWKGLRQSVEADATVPDREEVLAILDKVTDKEHCKLLLRRLNGGTAYRYIYKNLLPRLRNAAVCTIRLILPADTLMTEKVIVEEKTVPVFNAEARTEPSGEQFVSPIYNKDNIPFATTDKKARTARLYLALKTNLLLWGGVTPEGELTSFRPNLSAEVFLARRWSVMASAEYTNWQGGKGNKFRAVSGYSLEPRIWLWGDGAYRWIYVGAYGQTGDYDYQPHPDGDPEPVGASVTGTYWSTGLSLGIYVPLTRHWGLEAGLRGGYRKATGKAYDNEPPYAYYHHDAPSTHWGITGLNFSVTYRWLTK